MENFESHIENHRLNDAFKSVNRALFLPPGKEHLAKQDMPVLIGHEQTNSQPSVVRTMLEMLDVQPDEDVLDVGAGSGWTSALLGYLSAQGGKVIGTERLSSLAQTAKNNIAKNFRNI
jgi:protein-L-isoaspartate(D-aspartate) O-methyltransferase